MSSSLKLLVVDEKTLVRKSLFNLLRTEQPSWTIHEAQNTSDLSDVVRRLEINVVLINTGAASRSFELVRSMRKQHPELKIVLLLQYTEPAMIIHAIKLGVNGLLPITSDPQELITALRLVLYEGNYFNGVIKNAYETSVINDMNTVKLELSINETRIVDLLCKGNNTKQISEAIGLTPFTVDSYRKKLLQKTKSRNVAHLISLMHRTGIL